MTIIWCKDIATLPLDHDFNGEIYGKYVDICGNGEGKWMVLFNCVLLKDDFDSRDAAQHWAENADLIDELSEAPRY